MTDHAAAVEAVRGRVAAAQKDLERFFAENPHLKTDEGWIADCATLLRAYEAVVEDLDNLRGAYHDMRAMGLPDVLTARPVLDAALAWETMMQGAEPSPFSDRANPYLDAEATLIEAVRAWRAAEEEAHRGVQEGT